MKSIDTYSLPYEQLLNIKVPSLSCAAMDTAASDIKQKPNAVQQNTVSDVVILLQHGRINTDQLLP